MYISLCIFYQDQSSQGTLDNGPGESGGIGFHSEQEWDPRFSYSSVDANEVPTKADWLAIYRQMLGKIQGNIPNALSGAIHTDLTDVEWAINGIMTYARVHAYAEKQP